MTKGFYLSGLDDGLGEIYRGRVRIYYEINTLDNGDVMLNTAHGGQEERADTVS